jgi:hypothetical protein
VLLVKSTHLDFVQSCTVLHCLVEYLHSLMQSLHILVQSFCSLQSLTESAALMAKSNHQNWQSLYAACQCRNNCLQRFNPVVICHRQPPLQHCPVLGANVVCFHISRILEHHNKHHQHEDHWILQCWVRNRTDQVEQLYFRKLWNGCR